MNEIWKDILGYEGMYQASDLGRVRSMDRTVPNGHGGAKRLKGRILKQHNCGTNPYFMVVLCKEAKRNIRTVHSLVAETFIGPRPEGMEVLHGEGRELNNQLSNLRYGTRSENMFERVQAGTQCNKPVRRGDGKEFTSAMEAERMTKVNASSVRGACNKYVNPNTGKRRLTAGGFSWEFI